MEVFNVPDSSANGPRLIRTTNKSNETSRSGSEEPFLISGITSEAGTKLTRLHLKANEAALINESDLQGGTHQQPGANAKSPDQETDIKKDF